MQAIGIKELLEVGAHYGHQARRWDPRMRKYIFTVKNGIHVIDLQQTVTLLDRAYHFVVNEVAKGGKVLFLGLKKEAQEVILKEAERSNQFYINYRWLGGMLTNFKSLKVSIDRMREVKRMSTDGTFEKLPKKEVVLLKREYAKLYATFNGIRDMQALPKIIFVLDPKSEQSAIREARKLDIPVISIVDTNCNPDMVDYPIPANDDSIRVVSLIIQNIANACIEGAKNIVEKLDKNAYIERTP
ncbi:MAG: 30S ribosomal protein S2 [Deltaproteobacteria bacterium]|nr:MAG: 30S ribosomal protein S2 [Deltaproteobacteria bacterium]